VPISWTNRTSGTSKLKIQEMGSRYLFIVLYVWLEHHLSRGDYRRQPVGRLRPSQSEPLPGPEGEPGVPAR
jgi:dolichol-phosphate mannosyltransferase